MLTKLCTHRQGARDCRACFPCFPLEEACRWHWPPWHFGHYNPEVKVITSHESRVHAHHSWLLPPLSQLGGPAFVNAMKSSQMIGCCSFPCRPMQPGWPRTLNTRDIPEGQHASTAAAQKPARVAASTAAAAGSAARAEAKKEACQNLCLWQLSWLLWVQVGQLFKRSPLGIGSQPPSSVA